MHAPDGTSPTINMFLWDGAGCWGADVDGDGSADLDGDYDLDILVHEFHHGVSLRLNTAFTGNEAGAIGEGGGDFFAYSVNNDPVLADYALPGGLRAVNGKGYGDWSCLLGLFCEVHDNGEIWANVLWDVRERFRADAVNGSDAAATAESHQLYIDALALSPPAPTMLDMRDAMLLADATRNPVGSSSANFCRLWESFAARGMGVGALDTADRGLNQVTAAYDVPAGCVAPPGPPVVSITTTVATANEAGADTGERDDPPRCRVQSIADHRDVRRRQRRVGRRLRRAGARHHSRRRRGDHAVGRADRRCPARGQRDSHHHAARGGGLYRRLTVDGHA